MKSNTITFILALALAACEGEPPKTPSGPAVPPEHEHGATTPDTTEPAVDPNVVADHEHPHGANGALCPCACNCMGGAVAGSDAGVDPDAARPEAGAPPVVVAEPTTGTLHGAVLAKPQSVAANAVVYLEDAPIEPNARMNVTIDNRQMLFTPFVAVIPTGGRITFHNSDPFPHNVFSPDHERFDMGAIPNGQGRVRVFKSPGSYAVLCNLHPGMLGYVVVTPGSYYAKADGKGHYTMKNVPNGTYKLTAWAPRQEPATQSVTVKGNDISVDFDLHRTP